jgi:adenylate/nucleoside-diphosphate kinase
VREIPAGGTPEEIAARIRLEIDPFAVRCDNPEDVRVSSELEEEAKRLPKGNFGDFCPVTFVKDGWLVKGSPEHEVTIYGKTHLLAGDAELALFKADPAKYLAGDASLPLAPPPPKIMIIGVKGSGVTTQVRLLCEKFKLQDLKLKEAFLAMMRAEKEKRKRRRLFDRGFRPPLPAEEDAEGPPPDPEIEDDPEDFDKEAHERTLMKLITDASKGLVIDGSWTAFGEDSGVTAVDAAGFAGLLIESRRAPELVIMLKCEEASAFERMIDAAATKAEYERLMTARTDARTRQRALDRATKATELEEALAADEEKSPDDKAAEVTEAMAKWEEDRDAEEDA